MKNIKHIILSSIFTSLICIISNFVFATNYSWVGNTSTDWGTSANWGTTPGVPSTNDTVLITSAGTFQPVLDQTRTVKKFTITSGTLNLNTYDLTISNTSSFTAGTISNGKIYPNGVQATYSGTTFNCEVNSVAGKVFLSGSTFNYRCYFEDTITNSSHEGAGGCTFNASVVIKKNSGANFGIAGTNGNTFNDSVTCLSVRSANNFTVTDQGTTYFNGNVIVGSSTNGDIYFSGAATLASGKTISVDGTTGFSTGTLHLNNFTQSGSTAQSFTLTSSATVSCYNATWNGAVSITAPHVLLKTTTFNGTASFYQTHPTIGSVSDGGNTFNGAATLNCSGAVFRMGTTYDDTFNSDLTVIGFVSVGYSNTTILKGNLTAGGSNYQFNGTGVSGTLKFAGSNSQHISSGGTGIIGFNKMKIDKTGGSVTLDSTITVDDTLTFVSGNIISTSTHLLSMLAGSTVTGASNSSFVSGPVQKTGNTAFIFPCGKNSSYRPIEMTAPSVNTNSYTGEYFDAGQSLGSTLGYPLNTLSDCNYWKFDRNSGSSNVTVKFLYSTSACDWFSMRPVHIANWTGSYWNDKGEAVTDGSFKKTNAATSTFGYFAFAYTLVDGDACRLPYYLTPHEDCQPTELHFKNNHYWFQFIPDSLFTAIDLIKDDPTKNYSHIKKITVYDYDCSNFTAIQTWDFSLTSPSQNALYTITELTDKQFYFIDIERYDSTSSCSVCDSDSVYLKICLINIPVPVSPGTISHSIDNFFGLNGTSTLYSSTYWNNSNLKNVLPSCNTASLRYPGGAVANYWDWRQGWFKKADNSSGCFTLPVEYQSKTQQTNADDLGNFKQSADKTHSLPVWVLNNLTSDQLYQLAMLYQGKGMNLTEKRVEIGNEFYISRCDYEEKYNTAADYASDINAWKSTIQTYLPNTKISAVASYTGGNPDQRRKTWNAELTDASAAPDAFSIHQYSGLGQFSYSSPVSPSEFDPFFVSVFNNFDNLNDDIDDLPANSDIWMTEYNLSTQQMAHGTWLHGLFTAVQTLSFLENPQIKLVTLHSMISDGIYGSIFRDNSGLNGWSDFTEPLCQINTVAYGKTALGLTTAMIGAAVESTTQCEDVSFAGIPQLSNGRSVVYGWYFTNSSSTEKQMVLINMSSTSISTLPLSSYFSSSAHFDQLSTSNADYYVTGGTNFAIASCSASGTLNSIANAAIPGGVTIDLPAFSITRVYEYSSTPAITISVLNDPVCLGTSVSFMAHGGPPGSYVWSTSATTDVISATPSSAGTYTVSVTSTGGATATKSITVVAVPTLTASATSSTICPGASITLNASLSGAGTLTYIWTACDENNFNDCGGNGIGTGSSLIISPGPIKTTRYTVFASNGSCFSPYQNVDVTVNPPYFNFDDERVICSGSSTNIDPYPATNNTPTYLWSLPATTQDITVSPTVVTTYTLTVTQGACSRSDQIKIVPVDCSCDGGGYDATMEPQSVLYDDISTDLLTSLGITPSGSTVTISNSNIAFQGSFSLYDYEDNKVSKVIFDNCTLTFNERAEFNVEPGNTVIFNQCILEDCNGVMWKGLHNKAGVIVTQDPPAGTNRTSIEGAEYAFNCDRGSTLDLTRNDATDCYISIKADDIDANNFNFLDLTVKSSKFLGTGSLLTPYIDQTTILGDYPYAGMLLKNLTANIGVAVSGTNWLRFDGLNNGIHSTDCSLYITGSQFTDIQPDATYSGINGCGIFSQATPGNYGSLTQIGLGTDVLNSFTFDNCLNGIYGDGVSMDIQQNKMQDVNTGVDSRNTSLLSVLVSYNEINALWRGVNLQNEIASKAHVMHNSISIDGTPGVDNRGISATGFSPTLLKRFAAGCNDITVDNGFYGIYIDDVNYAGTRDNNIILTNSNENLAGIRLVASTKAGVAENSVTGNDPATFGYNAYSFSLNNNPSVNINTSTGTYYGFEFQGPNGSTSSFRQNIMDEHYFGLHLDQSGIIGVQNLTQNKWYGYTHGWTYGTSSGNPNIGAVNQVATNQFDVLASQFFVSSATTGTIYSPYFDVPNFSSAPWFDYSPNSPIIIAYTDYCNPIPDRVDSIVSLDSLVVMDSLHTAKFQPQVKELTKRDLFDKLHANEDLRGSNQFFSDFYDSLAEENAGKLGIIKYSIESLYTDAVEEFGDISINDSIVNARLASKAYNDSLLETGISSNDSLALIEENKVLLGTVTSLCVENNTLLNEYILFRDDALDELKSLNDDVTGGTTIEENEKEVNDIYLRKIAKINLNLSAGETDTLQSIAEQCPFEGGRSVYTARAILALIGLEEEYDDETACTGSPRLASNQSHGYNDFLHVSVIPNPARDNVTIKYHLKKDEGGILELKDLAGRLIFHYELAAGSDEKSFSVSTLQSGLYLFGFRVGNKELGKGKLSVIR
ncbi:MAG TPA: T9SS type A sorting domain-containing protein [Bacteroidia bacterium]|nr:T9SS type A sorting domain-containing protein [Bacteroidia bacterium]